MLEAEQDNKYIRKNRIRKSCVSGKSIKSCFENDTEIQDTEIQRYRMPDT
jgi:hypothetical protein